MNDLELEKQLKEAFDNVKMPQDLRARTIAAASACAEAEESAPKMPVAGAKECAERANASKPHRALPRKRALRFAYGIAACLVVALAGVFGYRYMTAPTAFIDIDVNPSIELAVNRFDNVVSAEALNSDAQTVLDQADIIGESYVDAVEALMTVLAREGYDLGDAYVEFSISSDDTRQTTDLESSTDSLIASSGYSGHCNVVDESVHAAAHACNMGVGKYLAAQELSELDPDITIEECSHMSMRQIRDGINACHSRNNASANGAVDSGSAEADSSSAYNAGNGNGYGNGSGSGAGNGNGYGAQGGHHGQGHGYRHHS